MDLDHVNLEVRCDCGHQFEVNLGRLKQDRQFTCPACGETTADDEEGIAAVDGLLGSVADGFVDSVRKGLGDDVRKIAKKANRRR
jgi:hypothetical protein